MKRRVLANRVLLCGVVGAALIAEPGWHDRPGMQTGLHVAGFVLLAAAAFGRAWAALHIAGNKNRELVVYGPYSLTRNPLYLCSLAGFSGVGLAFGSFLATLLLCSAFFATHWPAILYEETLLASRFGRAFADYASAVPRFLPAWRMPQTPDRIEINGPAFARALGESLLILMLYPLARLIDWAHAASLLPQLFRLY